MSSTGWKSINDQHIPWIPKLNQLVSTASLPVLNGSTIYIASDYSGYHRKSKYEVISLLIMDTDNSWHWTNSRRCVREHFLTDGHRISFKGLHDQRQFYALPAFLESANNIVGICVNIVLRKSVRISYIDRDRMQSMVDASPFLGKWSYKTLNHMFRIVHFISLFIGGLSKPGQNVYWISDQDPIFANPSNSEDAARLVSVLTNMYIDHKLGELGIGTTILDEGDRLLEDLVAIPDLSAGALSEYLTALCDMCDGKIIGKFVYPSPRGITPKTEQIVSWLMDNTGKLKRLILLFESAENNMARLTRLEIK